MNKHRNMIFFPAAAVVAALLLVAAAACRKMTDYPIRPSIQKTDSAGSLSQALDSSGCRLFSQAFHRASLDSALTPNGAYTVFAPTDSAMVAAGLTAQVIAGLSPDSLSMLVRYHIVYGAYNDDALSSAVTNITGATLVQDIRTDSVLGDVVYQQNLYLKENTVLYVNGEAVGSGTPSVATYNGYLLKINKFLAAPHGTLWDVITSDPRLTLYAAALRIDDSIFFAYQQQNAPWAQSFLGDSVFFSRLYYMNVSNNIISKNLPTVFAPTDAAFNAAGLHTVDDIRSYALSTPITPTGNYSNFGMVYNDIPMDSILYGHVVYNKGNTAADQQVVLYNDMVFSPLMNNGLPNASDFQALVYMSQAYFQPNPLHFTVAGGVPYIQWNASQPPAPVLPDTDPAQPRHFFTRNGALYIVDQLFTSPN